MFYPSDPRLRVVLAGLAVVIFVGQLRKKIETAPNSPVYIKTEPWIGYRFHSEP
jgi:DNA-binding response OmpR family regulator